MFVNVNSSDAIIGPSTNTRKPTIQGEMNT